MCVWLAIFDNNLTFTGWRQAGVARRQVTFSCLAKRKSPKRRPPPAAVLRTSLRCAPSRVAAELALRAQTVLAEAPVLAVLLGAVEGGAAGASPSLYSRDSRRCERHVGRMISIR